MIVNSGAITRILFFCYPLINLVFSAIMHFPRGTFPEFLIQIRHTISSLVSWNRFSKRLFLASPSMVNLPTRATNSLDHLNDTFF